MTLNPPLRETLLAEMGDDANLTARSSSGVMSPAKLTLQRIHMQSSTGTQNKDAPRTGDNILGLHPKGKPRLLLMGQRR
jgi:Ras-related GTP-binding protein C/D